MQVEICKCCGKPKKKVIGRGVGYSEGRVPMRQLGAGGMGRDNEDRFITSPATPAAAEWDGWGTALKPAWEPIIVARKPLCGTVAENVQRYGTGAMNIDGCRIETDWENDPSKRGFGYGVMKQGERQQYADRANGEWGLKDNVQWTPSQGRWPANLIHDGSAEVLAGFPNAGAHGGIKTGRSLHGNVYDLGLKSGVDFDVNGYNDTGSAARFFYCAKASKQDRDEGCEDLEGKHIGYYAQDEWSRQNMGQTPDAKRDPVRNHHPTVKPTALMRYLCRLITPPNGTILDPFMGSGSTGKAAMLEGFNFIGIDTEIEYVEIAARRIEHACEKVGIVIEQPMMFETQRETIDKPKQLILL